MHTTTVKQVELLFTCTSQYSQSSGMHDAKKVFEVKHNVTYMVIYKVTREVKHMVSEVSSVVGICLCVRVCGCVGACARALVCLCP